jgi:hypothetical protein
MTSPAQCIERLQAVTDELASEGIAPTFIVDVLRAVKDFIGGLHLGKLEGR